MLRSQRSSTPMHWTQSFPEDENDNRYDSAQCNNSSKSHVLESAF